jgi:predicted SAM-dependent methyltransferase
MSKKETVEIPTIESVPKIIKYDFACGARKCSPEHIGVDIAGEGVDIKHNLFQFPYFFAENDSADEIHTSHFVEHVPMVYWNERNEMTIIQKDENSVELFEKFISECHRILKKGGKLTVIAPYYNSSRCWQDPTHRRAITEATFLYFNKDWKKANGLEHCHENTSDFDFTYGYQMDQMISARNQEFQSWAIKHYTNSVLDIIVTLTKK